VQNGRNVFIVGSVDGDGGTGVEWGGVAGRDGAGRGAERLGEYGRYEMKWMVIYGYEVDGDIWI
jgi:hypothetical protein